jgi:PAS domain S-box-containing protein
MFMMGPIENANIAAIGGGGRCKALLQAIFSAAVDEKRPAILGVADIDPQAAGLRFAKEKGIFTTPDYRDLFYLKDLDVIIDLTGDDRLLKRVRSEKPPGILLVDHDAAQSILDYFNIKRKKSEILKELRRADAPPRIEALFEEFYDHILKINRERDATFRKIQENLAQKEWAMSQIIQGSTIPTFVIDRDHRVTHWNRACEKLTGLSADEMVGTDRQWKPFRSEKRPTMADLILEGIEEESLWRHYGTGWEKSDLIQGAYEAEEFFPQLGSGGTWLFFTAAPIKAPDGSVVGAIETLWDKTREKQAEAERERQNKELAQKVKDLTASEKVMAQIIQGSTIPTFVIDKHHRVTHWNRALERLTGFAADEMVGTTRQWAPFYAQERPSMADVILDQKDASEIRKLYGTKWRPSVLIEGAYEAEVFFPNLGDEGKWCWFTAAPLRTPDGDVVGAIETIWDKTEDRKAEKQRERHTKELATFCSIYATLSSALSLQERIEAAIQEVADIFLLEAICIFIRQDDGRFHLKYSSGYSEELCYHNRIAGSESMITHVAQTGKPIHFKNLPDSPEEEMALLKQEGLRSLAYIPIRNREKRTFGVIRSARKNTDPFDTDEIRALELIGNRIGVAIENTMLQDEVRRKANFQAKLIGSSHDGIVATDEDWKIVVFNPAAENIFGYSASEVTGKDAGKIYPPAVKKNFEAALADSEGNRGMPWQETAIASKDGEEIPVMFSVRILLEKNRMMGTVAFFHDLREIKRLERELVNAERLAAVGQTVAGMAHCVKNILHGLKGGSYMVNIGIDKNKPEKLKTGWDMVQRNIARTSDLVQDLLSYSKERAPEFKACDPNVVAEEVCDSMQSHADENDIEMVKDFTPDIGEVILDPRILYRVLMNLVSNAVDACRFDDSAEKAHRVTVATAVENGQTLRVDVSDNGAGMSEAVQAKLFSSFFSTKGAQGTGLGLLVSSKLVEEHNGTITVDSRLGQGTTFSLRLPFERPADD